MLQVRADDEESPTVRPADVQRRGEALWRKPLLAIHIVASVDVLGGDLVLLALGISGARGAERRPSPRR